MTKPKPPRVLNYDPEYGYIVAGTHDVDLARGLLAEHLERQDDPQFDQLPLDQPRREAAEAIVGSLGEPSIGWGRCSMAHYDGDHAWMWERTEPNARGAFRAVEWQR